MVKKILIGAAVVLGAIALGIAGLVMLGTSRLNADVQLPAETIALPTDPERIAEGERLTAVHQCTECHGENLGGADFIASDAFMHLPAPNLTRGKGGLAGQLTPAEWEHAIRHGVGRDGRPLIIMPANTYAMLTDADLTAIIAYAEHAPPVDTPAAERRFGPIGRLVAGLKADDLMPARTIDHSASHQAALPAGDTAALGLYLSRNCIECHRADLAGGPVDFAGGIFASNLTSDPATGLGTWSETDFSRVLREGTRPDGTTVDVNMPWRGYARFTDDEISSLWIYLTGLPAIRRAPE